MSFNRKHKLIQAMSRNGPKKLSTVDIPKIKFKHEKDQEFPIESLRIQFPIKLSFLMTITNSQGQTFQQKVGI